MFFCCHDGRAYYDGEEISNDDGEGSPLLMKRAPSVWEIPNLLLTPSHHFVIQVLRRTFLPQAFFIEVPQSIWASFNPSPPSPTQAMLKYKRHFSLRGFPGSHCDFNDRWCLRASAELWSLPLIYCNYNYDTNYIIIVFICCNCNYAYNHNNYNNFKNR